jgi:hypothetical protein
MAIELKYTFDSDSYRHFLNGHEMVLHCHHYMTLTAKMAEDFADIGGPAVMQEVAEETIRPVLDSYVKEHGISEAEQRLVVGKEYYAVMGLGLMEVTGSAEGGEVRLPHSHFDEGWIKKWGKRDTPANYFTRGYVAAMFAVAFDRPPGSYEVSETASIVTGDETSIFVVKPA